MKWSFQQLDGPSADRKTLYLDGWAAPFGRPRREPVIKEVIKSRIQTTRYPGSNGQTRHAFGTNWESTELKGRWMTKALTADDKNANDMANEWTEFMRDQRTCRIAWGVIVSYVGYISEIEIARESEHDIAWRMKIEIDVREELDKRQNPLHKSPISDNLEEASKIFVNFGKLLTPVADSLDSDFFDSLNDLAALVNTPSAVLNKLVGQFDDIEKATFSTIQHFRGGLTGVYTALVGMRDVVLNAGIDSALAVRSAQTDVEWIRYQADFDNQSMIVLDLLNQMDRKAELAQKQEASKFVLAKEGDSWESIATRASGGPEKAGEVRTLNGARYGDRPVPGESYLVPG